MLVLAAAVAIATAPAVFDPRAPGFWERRYDFPTERCQVSISVNVESVEKAFRHFTACPQFRLTVTDPMSFGCRVPPEEGERIVAALKSEGELLYFHRQCASPPEPAPDLDYKLEVLRRESLQLNLSSGSFPSITALLEVQLGTLSWLVKRRDQASSHMIGVILGTRGRDESSRRFIARNGWGGMNDVGPLPENFKLHPWTRSPIRPCTSVPSAVGIYSPMGDPNIESRIIQASKRLGEPGFALPCSRTGSDQVVSMVFSRKPLSEIREVMTSIPGMEHWDVSRDLNRGWNLADDDKYERLRAEQASLGSRLTETPVLAAFLDAELDRLRPSFEAIKRMRDGHIVVFARPQSK